MLEKYLVKQSLSHHVDKLTKIRKKLCWSTITDSCITWGHYLFYSGNFSSRNFCKIKTNHFGKNDNRIILICCVKTQSYTQSHFVLLFQYRDLTPQEQPSSIEIACCRKLWLLQWNRKWRVITLIRKKIKIRKLWQTYFNKVFAC